MCASKVRETLTKLNGVENTVVDFKAKTATVTLAKPTSKFSEKMVGKAITDLGFKMTSFDQLTPVPSIYKLGVTGMT